MSRRLEEILGEMLGNMQQMPVTEPEQPRVVCPDCDGFGYYRLNVPVDDPRFGKMFKCPNPQCPAVQIDLSQRSQKIFANSDWNASYGKWTFEKFEALVEGKWKGKRGGYSLAKTFAVSDGKPFSLNQAARTAFGDTATWPVADGAELDTRRSHSVMLTGDVGQGKTSLAVSATNEKLKRFQSVVFIRIRELMRRLQEPYQPHWDGPTTGNLIKFYSEIPCLILDEFGIKNYTPDRLELIESVMRERDKKNLPFLATTNLSIDDFKEQWTPQIADIVQKAHWVEVSGYKLRQTRNKVESW